MNLDFEFYMHLLKYKSIYKQTSPRDYGIYLAKKRRKHK